MRRIAHWPPALRWGAAALLLLALAPIPAVSLLEEHDSFCAACHTLPEVTYYDRAQMLLAGVEPALDLSSAHYAAQGGFRCIDCHRGNGGVAHRAATLALGARDALIFVSGRADPAIEKSEIEAPALLTAGCVKCHADSLLVTGFENHYHNKLPDAYAAWQAGGQLTAPPGQPVAAELQRYEVEMRCLDCHRTHVHVPGAEAAGFLDLENVTYPACVRCHAAVGKGPLDLGGG
jgi:hypothetical protein